MAEEPGAADPRGAGADLRSFGRRRGRKLSARQASLIESRLPALTLPVDAPPPEPLTAMFADPAVTASAVREVWLEIGFGGAEHLVWQAARNPAVGIIGCEPFEEGIVKALTAIEAQGLANVRLHPDDARTVLRWLPAASLDRVFILFPDPWPKRKHRKRRLVQQATLEFVARALRSGGTLRLATDIGDYARTMLLAVRQVPELVWTAGRPRDWRQRAADWPATRYEQKALREGRRSYYLELRRL
jgi:tRNA (guanine-N7-)-methyltransferase